jgi:ornithine cyclodeaminase
MPSTDSKHIAIITADQVLENLPMQSAISALAAALEAGLDPEDSPARGTIPLKRGSFLLMPGEFGEYAGVKILTVAPDNYKQQLPRIQGNYLLFESATLRPLALIDGIALTCVRTPAVSALAIDRLAKPEAKSLTVFGTGPQAFYHVRAIAAVRSIEKVTIIGRSASKTDLIVGALRREGYNAEAGSVAAVSNTDIVACCTSASEPLFDGSLVDDDAVVVAMGSHDRMARETDDVLAKRSVVYVEDVDTALREAGDVAIGVKNGTIGRADLKTLSSLVRDGAVHRQGPALFKSVGMGWQDLVTASAIYEQLV